jgi:YbdK family carboxylate-amine ligase
VTRAADQAPVNLLDGVRERFDDGVDFTVGLEEEYQLLDPADLRLVSRFEELIAAADEGLRPRLAGELIASEIEFKTGRNIRFAEAARELVEGRLAVIALAERLGIGIGIGGVHPFSPWTEQRIIDTAHYARVEGELGYLAWINNTWAIHAHVGVRGADRAVAVSTAMRSVLPELLALSANSPILYGRDTRLHSARTQIFTRSFPRCGVPDAYRDWAEYADFVALMERTGSIVEGTQIWWSVRPHHSFGTVEIRICDGQSEMTDEQTLVAGASAAFGPNDTGANKRTEIYGVDLYWKWKPANAHAGFPFVSWQTEANYQRFQAAANLTVLSRSVPCLAATRDDSCRERSRSREASGSRSWPRAWRRRRNSNFCASAAAMPRRGSS